MTAESRMAAMEERVDHMEKDLREIKGDLKTVLSRTDRWSGTFSFIVFGAPVALGALGILGGWFLKAAQSIGP